MCDTYITPPTPFIFLHFNRSLYVLSLAGFTSVQAVKILKVRGLAGGGTLVKLDTSLYRIWFDIVWTPGSSYVVLQVCWERREEQGQYEHLKTLKSKRMKENFVLCQSLLAALQGLFLLANAIRRYMSPLNTSTGCHFQTVATRTPLWFRWQRIPSYKICRGTKQARELDRNGKSSWGNCGLV